MLNQETQKLIHEYFLGLPPVVQDIVLHSGWQDKIRRIVQNNKLHIDQGAAIENLVFMTMLGIENPETFVENAKEHARVTQSQAYAISTEVEREIFHDIRQKLIEITESHDTIDEVERVTNELTKVDDDIGRQTTTEHEDDVVMHSIASANRPKRKPEPMIINPVSMTPAVSAEATTKQIPQSKPKIFPTSFAAPSVIPQSKPKIVPITAESKNTPAPQIVEEKELPTLRFKREDKPAEPIVTKTPETKPNPADVPIRAAAKVPFVPKQLDPIVAARLGKSSSSARERLEMEVSDNALKAGELTLSEEEVGVGNSPKTYGLADPYREEVV